MIRISRLPTLFLALPLWAAQEAPKGLEAHRTQGSIHIDGKLGEGDWTSAPTATDFVQEWPDRGKAAHQRTEVRVLYDDRFVYIGARMHHDPALDGGKVRVVRRLHRRDQDSQSDWFGVAIDSQRDRRTAFLFEVNAAGVQRDQVVFADTNFDSSWDGVWESAVTVDEGGWTAELRIPLELLRLRKGVGTQIWGINFNRSDQGQVREFTRWSLVPRGESAFVSRFPELTGVQGLEPRLRREWIPFLSGSRKFETAKAFDDRGWDAKAGLDAHLGITSHSHLDLALRPDFGQVEVDQAVLNLSTVETFFPEKRAFFLEGSEIFRTVGPQLFYSRRIGRGVGDPELNPGETIQDRPLASDISAAAKYTAKYDSGLNVGLLGARVDPARAQVRTASGELLRREVSPLTAFGVLRAQQPLDNRGSYLGGFVSYAHQAGVSGREATVTAVDGVLASEDRSGKLDFALIKSEAGLKGSALPGWFGRLYGQKDWSTGWSGALLAVNASHDFEINDLGYRGRADEQFLNLTATRRWDKTHGIFRNWEWGFDGQVNRDQAGRVFNRWIGTRAKTDFTNFFALWMSTSLSLPADDDRELRTYADPVKKYLRRPAIRQFNLGFDTPGNKPWYLNVDANRVWNEGGPSTDLRVFQVVKPTSAMSIEFTTVFTHQEGERHWFETQGLTPIVGLRQLQEFNQTIRVAYAFTPRLTVQLFSQWLADTWKFQDLQAYVDDRTLGPASTTSETAFSYRVWNLNLITRWEFRPGSAFFLVYTHGARTDQLINDRASFSPRPDLAILRHLPSDDVVQMKVSWLFR